MWSEVVNVTPEMAREFLAKSAGNPRFNNEKKVNKTVVAKYASDMRRGNFCLTPQGIAFNTNGELEDGHHRLHAIVESGCTVPMYVAHDAPVHAVYDNGYIRTPAQLLKFTFGITGDLASGGTIAVVKLHMYFASGENRNAMEQKTVYDICEFIGDNQDALLAMRAIQGRKRDGKRILMNASFGHAIFCALSCGVPEDIVSDFSDIVQSGFCDSEKKYAAILARNEIMSSARSMDVVMRAFQSKYMQTCLWDFYCGVKRVRKYSAPVAGYTLKMLEQ